MDLRDQVGAGDIDKAAGGKAKQDMGKIAYFMWEEVSQNGPAKGAEAGEKIVKKGLLPAEAPVDQDSEIP